MIWYSHFAFANNTFGAREATTKGFQSAQKNAWMDSKVEEYFKRHGSFYSDCVIFKSITSNLVESGRGCHFLTRSNGRRIPGGYSCPPECRVRELWGSQSDGWLTEVIMEAHAHPVRTNKRERERKINSERQQHTGQSIVGGCSAVNILWKRFFIFMAWIIERVLIAPD